MALVMGSSTCYISNLLLILKIIVHYCYFLRNTAGIKQISIKQNLRDARLFTELKVNWKGRARIDS